jgi:hypothetical protein
VESNVNRSEKLQELLNLKGKVEWEDGFTAERIRELNNQGSLDAAKQWRRRRKFSWLSNLFRKNKS